MSLTQKIILTQTSLEHVLSSVRGLYNMSTELIAEEVFRQMSELAANRITPVTIWCGRGGLYRSKLDAIRNGEQLVESVILVDTPDLAELAIDMTEANDARRAADFTNRRYSEAVQRAYPKGTKVRVGTGDNSITFTVTGYGSHHSSPGKLYGTNMKTGKIQHFYHSDAMEVIE